MNNAEDYLSELSTLKVVAFMEIEPLTDKFEQIALTEAQAKELRMKLFDIIAGVPDSPDTAIIDVITDNEVKVTLPDVRESYGEDFFKEDEHKDDKED